MSLDITNFLITLDLYSILIKLNIKNDLLPYKTHIQIKKLGIYIHFIVLNEYYMK